jgi:hypothetical protein
MGQRSLSEAISDSFSSDSLLSDTANHLTEINGISFTSAKSHNEGFVISIEMFDAIISNSFSNFGES